MQFSQLFLIAATVFTAAVQAKCTAPVNGSCSLPAEPLISVITCSVNNKVTKCCNKSCKENI
ncbi:uncharacterized protein PpBr36_10682 [Pyricularia pennisetigena]|uniref:uncharacterized protein n=1 Tax=Pyricularia pennisetigena TaxID=1578925 RepID=UPI0011519BAD|nr:uncharacterized protein PpBr36_10682 [Pyricularia pennisetigena]TLS20830.1 hypothetical protein PpBr36_10682 [Pyricularia pennisetigena]